MARRKDDPRDLRWWEFNYYTRDGETIKLHFTRGAVTRIVRFHARDLARILSRARLVEDWKIEQATTIRASLGNPDA